MAEDRNILDAIGQMLQKWESRKTKKKPGGLKSSIGEPSSLSKRDQVMLKAQLLAEKMDDRTDEGALMSLRSKFPNF